jgi:nucleoside-diphosphate-sugar epimerase
MDIDPLTPNVLVTGARGFIGKKLVEKLVREGKNLRVLTRGEQNAFDEISEQIDVWRGDLTKPSTLSGIAEGIHTVYHLAGEIRDPRRFDLVNRQGTKYLLKQCQSARVRRFLYLSSVGVMGSKGESGVLDESDSTKPQNGYEISKCVGEKLTLSVHNPSGMWTMAVRPTIVYGEGRNPNHDSFLSWIRLIKSGRFMQLGRDYISSYVYVGDVAAACLTVAEDFRTGGQVYIINEPIPLPIFIAYISAFLNVPEPKMFPKPIGRLAEGILRKTGRFASLYNRTTYSMDKLSDLGFILPYGYRKGLRRTINWYREMGLL